jgi:hypothetical protein
MLPTPRAFYLGVNGIGTKEGAEFYDAVITIKSASITASATS